MQIKAKKSRVDKEAKHVCSIVHYKRFYKKNYLSLNSGGWFSHPVIRKLMNAKSLQATKEINDNKLTSLGNIPNEILQLL